MQQRWAGLWVELAFGWPEKVGLLLSSSRSSLFWSELNELGTYCVGRGAVGLPLSILDGEDIVFSFQSAVRRVSMTAPVRGCPHAHAHWAEGRSAMRNALIASFAMKPWER